MLQNTTVAKTNIIKDDVETVGRRRMHQHARIGLLETNTITDLIHVKMIRS